MSSLADLPELIGFFSYSREDDEDSNGALSALRERIQRELRGQLGRSFKSFHLWQDKEAIAPGKLWEGEIKTAVEQSVFFIPIITPTVVKSPFCKFELDSFLAREQALGRTDLVFPILYIRVPALEDSDQWQSNPTLSIIAKRQYVDWREFRHLDVGTANVKEAIERFCAKIVEALYAPYSTPEELEAKRRDEEGERRKNEEAAARERAERERLAQEAKAKQRAEETRRKEEAEARRAEGERGGQEADSKAPPSRRPLLIAGAAGVVALLVVVWAGLYQIGAPVWVPWTAGPVQPDPAAEARRKADEEAALKKRMEEEAAAKKKQDDELRAKAQAEADAKIEEEQKRAELDRRRRAEEEAARKKAEEDARRKAEEDAKRDPALAVVPGSGQSFRDRLANGQACSQCPEMVVIPAGSFTMGSPENEPERFIDENPQLKVAIARPFAVGKFAVTRAEFETFVKATNNQLGDACNTWSGTAWASVQGKSFRDPGFSQDDKHPVVCVNWDDAKAYVAWLSKTTGKDYRLLSEAQREYVTRAGTTTPFWWGSSITPAQANYDGNYVYKGGGSKGEYRKRTVPVDSFESNPWGLYNVHGNVWEWAQDCYHGAYNGAPTDGGARTSGDCNLRVVRGGSWSRNPQFLRAAARGWNSSVNRVSNLGFRVGRTLTP